VDRAAGNANAGIQRLLLRPKALEGWQQRGVDIDLPPEPARSKAVALDAQETGVADELDALMAQRRFDGGIEVLPRGEVLVVDGERPDACRACALQAGRFGPVGDDDGDLRRITGRAR